MSFGDPRNVNWLKKNLLIKGNIAAPSRGLSEVNDGSVRVTAYDPKRTFNVLRLSGLLDRLVTGCLDDFICDLPVRFTVGLDPDDVLAESFEMRGKQIP